MIIRNHLDDPTERDLKRRAAVYAVVNEIISRKLTARGSTAAVSLSDFSKLEGGPLSNSEVDTLTEEIEAAGWRVREFYDHGPDGMVLQIGSRKTIEPCL